MNELPTMTTDQMAELAAKLRSAAGFFDGCLRDDLYSLVPHLNRAADLIAGMAQRVPLSDEQIVESFCRWPSIRHHVEAFKAGVQFAEQAHGIKGGRNDS
jgi:hypothetical protein